MDINKRCRDCKIRKKCLKRGGCPMAWQNDHNCYFYEPRFYVVVENWIEKLTEENMKLKEENRDLCKYYTKNQMLKDDMIDLVAENTLLQEAGKQAIELLSDINARVGEIIYHHSQPKKTRHGNTTRICEDIKSRIIIATEALKPKQKGGE